jgi:hypothetical protein
LEKATPEKLRLEEKQRETRRRFKEEKREWQCVWFEPVRNKPPPPKRVYNKKKQKLYMIFFFLSRTYPHTQKMFYSLPKGV